MDDSLPCPGCSTPLPPEATGCQICMRARTKQEIMRGYAKLREDKARKRRRPFQILAAVLVAGAAGKLLLEHRVKIAAAAGKARDAVVRYSDDMRDPSHYGPKPAPAMPAAGATGAPVPPEAALGAMLNPQAAPSPASPAMTATAAPPKPRPRKPVAKNAWRVSGTVYDLASLQPVPGAEITFLRDEKDPAVVTTDERGTYEIDLVKGAGWTVSMRTRDHRRGQILDIDPPYRDRDVDERRAALEHISDGDLNPAPLDWKRSASAVRLDLVAVAPYWIDAPQR